MELELLNNKIKIYLAGSNHGYKETYGYPHLVSFAEKHQLKSIEKNVTNDFIVDSGAFTAWKKQKQIDIDEYCFFIKNNDKNESVKRFVSLDVIKGTIYENCFNFEYILKNTNSNKISPVFHEGDHFDLIDNYFNVNPNLEHICLGLTKSRGKKTSFEFIFEFHDFIKRKNDKIKIHGLGITRKDILVQCEDVFESVDSTTWLNFAKYGFDSTKKQIIESSLQAKRAIGIICTMDYKDSLKEKTKKEKYVRQATLFDEL